MYLKTLLWHSTWVNLLSYFAPLTVLPTEVKLNERTCSQSGRTYRNHSTEWGWIYRYEMISFRWLVSSFPPTLILKDKMNYKHFVVLITVNSAAGQCRCRWPLTCGCPPSFSCCGNRVRCGWRRTHCRPPNSRAPRVWCGSSGGCWESPLDPHRTQIQQRLGSKNTYIYQPEQSRKTSGFLAKTEP